MSATVLGRDFPDRDNFGGGRNLRQEMDVPSDFGAIIIGNRSI